MVKITEQQQQQQQECEQQGNLDLIFPETNRHFPF
jgi:hypothetical protein